MELEPDAQPVHENQGRAARLAEGAVVDAEPLGLVEPGLFDRWCRALHGPVPATDEEPSDHRKRSPPSHPGRLAAAEPENRPSGE